MPAPKTRDQWLAENSRQIEVNGECLTLAQAAVRYGIKKRTLILRLARGWSALDAVLTPVRSRGGARA